MAWRKMMLRGATVFARCSESGDLVAEGGRVEIRYKPNDGRAYAAGVRNLKPASDATIFPDSHCGAAERPEPKKAGASKSGGKKSGGGRKTATVAKPPTAPSGEEILAYCDGACSGNPGPAGLGAVLLYDDTRETLSEFLGKGTNNIAELTAILRVAERAAPLKRPLRIYTDSSYSIGLLTKGWKPKKNQELVAELKAAIAQVEDWEIFHVKGHAGHALNELADTLAVQAVDARGSTRWTKG